MDLVAAGAFAITGAALLLMPAGWHMATFSDGEHPLPIDGDLAFYSAGALLLLVPIAGFWAWKRRLHLTTWTCAVIGLATALFWTCQIKFIFFGPWPT